MEEVLPDVYVDGAHNVSAIEAFVQSVPKDGRGNIVLFSAVQDKDYEEMIRCLCGQFKAEMFVVTQIGGDRGTDAQALAEVFRKYTEQPVIVKESVEEALRFMLKHQKEERVYCLGSLYLTGRIKELIQEVI